MIDITKKTALIVSAFVVVSTCVVYVASNIDMSSSDNESNNANKKGNDKYEDQTLKDDNGNSYVLHQNADGTETATYEDGKSVTFRRDSNGYLNPVSGSASMLSGLAMGYFLFHGLNIGNSGYYDSSSRRYLLSQPPSVMTKKDRDTQLNSGGYIPNSNGVSNNSAAVTSRYNSAQSSVSNSSTAKSGFGSAGARSAAS